MGTSSPSLDQIVHRAAAFLPQLRSGSYFEAEATKYHQSLFNVLGANFARALPAMCTSALRSFITEASQDLIVDINVQLERDSIVCGFGGQWVQKLQRLNVLQL